MIVNPRVGQMVRVWYRSAVADFMPYHNKIGKVVVVSRGRPRNHGVEIDGTLVAVPCGNLIKAWRD